MLTNTKKSEKIFYRRVKTSFFVHHFYYCLNLMKKIISRFTALVAVCVLLYGCSEESENLKKEKVQFGFNVASLSSSSGRALTEIPSGSILKISLTTPSGSPVLTNYAIELLSFGDDVISEPIQLAIGQYRITDFMIVNGSTVLYATPKNGSPLAGAVSHSLPYGFVVSKDQVKNVAMDVIDATQHTPQAFGYASFGVNVVNPLPIAVFRPQNTGTILTDATLTVYDIDNNVVQSVNLGAKTNYVPFTGDKDTEYRIAITKPGYIQYATVTTYAALMAELNGAPWQITLEAPNEYFSFFMPSDVWPAIIANGPTTVNVYYSDAMEKRAFAQDYDPEDFYTTFTYLGHSFWHSPDWQDQRVIVTGQLENIVELQFNDVDLERTQDLINLKRVILDNGDANLSTNTTLEAIQVLNGSILLPAEHNIFLVQLHGDISDVNAIIDNIHNNAVARGITGGTFDLGEVLEIPNEEAAAKLDALENNQGWTVYRNY